MHEPMSAEEISSGQPFARGRGADLGADPVGAVGGVGAVDQRLQLVEVDLDQLVVDGAPSSGAEVLGDLVGGVGDRLAAGGLEVRRPCCAS